MATETTLIPYVEGSAPATPASGRVVTYAKADGLMYSKDDAGTETLLSGGTAATRASLGLATSDSPEFAALNVGAATDTTITRTGAGEIAVEGNRIFRVGGADVPIADGGTGASTKAAAFDALSPMTTQDDLVIGGASGTGTRLAKGSDGQILTVDPTTHHLVWATNAGAADILDLPTVETDSSLVLAPDGAGGVEFRAETGGGGGGGAGTALGTYTASASATLDLATRNAAGQSGALIQSDFSVYEFLIENLLPATNNNQLLLRFSTNGGSSYDAGANYMWSYFFSYPGSSGASGAAGDSAIDVGGNQVASAHVGVSGSGRLIAPGSSDYKVFNFDTTRFHQGLGQSVHDNGHGLYVSATAVDAVRFLYSSGNITSGRVRVIGY